MWGEPWKPGRCWLALRLVLCFLTLLCTSVFSSKRMAFFEVAMKLLRRQEVILLEVKGMLKEVKEDYKTLKAEVDEMKKEGQEMKREFKNLNNERGKCDHQQEFPVFEGAAAAATGRGGRGERVPVLKLSSSDSDLTCTPAPVPKIVSSGSSLRRDPVPL